MRKVPLEQLTPEMSLGLAICSGTNILINAGTMDLPRYANRLREMGVSHLFVEDTACEGIEIDEMVSSRTRMKCKQTLEKTFRQIDTRFSVDARQLADIAERLLEELLSRANVLTGVSEIGGIGDNTLDHSLNTTIYAISLGMQLKYDKQKMLELAQGTLLHDIGKTALDSRILFKPGALTQEEFEHVKQHPVLGYNMLKRDKTIPEACRQICLFHHERMDGTGYPNGLKGNELPEFTRVTAVVDVYEALTVDRCYHKAIPPQRAIEVMTEELDTKFDFQLASLFIRNVAVYPNGSTVLLSSGQYAVVSAQNNSFPLRPVVRVVRMERGKCMAQGEIDLLTTLNITIVESDVTLPVG